MLAVEVVLAGADPVPTFVFDEVDAGVGGKAAVEVGRRLAALARDGPGHRRDPPAAGRGLRRPAPGRAQGRRRRGDPQRRRARSTRRAGCGSCPGCSPASRSPKAARAHAQELLAAAAEDKLAG